MEKYLYLIINILTLVGPLSASFYPKAPFYKKWKYVFPAIALTAFIFIVWDEVFTRMSVWGFNERYLLGIYIGNLPLEEILFFICIPYACVFTYFSLSYLIKKDILFLYQKHISIVLLIVLLVIGVSNLQKWYTAVSFIMLALMLTFQLWVLKPTYMGRFYFAYLFILLPFLVVNGVLTGSFIEEEVVWYNNAENLFIRIGTIPVEDIFYGMLLILINVILYESIQDWHLKIKQRGSDSTFIYRR